MELAEEEVQARVRETAAIVGLSEEILKQSPFLLSGGQKRRVAIAGVMAMRPEVLILDEPTAGLDPRGREEILQEIQAYRNQTGATILLVSHSMEDVARHAKNSGDECGKGVLLRYGGKCFRRSQELQAIGLAVPQITRVCDALRARGVPLTDDIFTVEQAKTASNGTEKGGQGHAERHYDRTIFPRLQSVHRGSAVQKS
ncbi:MAG: ATP-binding cassette domain-containing protein, partial [Ruminococcus callidus]